MAPGRSQNSYTRVHLWILIWLTCLFLENVQCTSDPDYPIWLKRALARDFDPSCNPSDLNSIPSPQSPLISHGNNQRPQPVDQQEWQNDPANELETPARKKLKTFSPNTRPFQIIHAERPVESERRVIFEAVRSLEQTTGDKLIGNEGEGEYRMLQIEEDQINTFLLHCVHRTRKTSPCPVIGKPRPPSQTAHDFTYQQVRKRRGTVGRFNIEASKLALRPLYTDRVVPKFAESLERVRRRVRDRTLNLSITNYLIDDLERILGTLPLYLFYADLINTVIPAPAGVLGSEGATTFVESQRRKAGLQFFQHVSDLIEDYYEPNDTFLGTGSLAKTKLSTVSNHSPFCWAILTKWIESSRPSLASRIMTPDPKAIRAIPSTFKQFFNEILTSYVEKL
ncbi:hypothetical protein PtB15_3B51 [Puccinia triticina]|nr:hypothetical protein PtB15_3B51 [Puccinia triticina]